MNKKALEFSFAWLFAIIVGAIIIFIAIFATTRLVDTERTSIDTQTAAELGIILNPIETNLEDSKYAVIGFSDETRVHNTCRETGNFGRQIISTSIKSGIGEEFLEPKVENFFFNKYLFSQRIEQGQELHVLAKGFEFPYKVADLLFVSAKNYCFVNPPGDIEDEISDLSPKNIVAVQSEGECSDSEIVCFGKTGCDIDVNLQSKIVVKNNQQLHYEGDLIYGAIFADPQIYECQVKRLMKRTGELAHVYADKTEFLENKGCSSNLASALRDFATSVKIDENEDSEKLQQISLIAEQLEDRNDRLTCKLF